MFKKTDFSCGKQRQHHSLAFRTWAIPTKRKTVYKPRGNNGNRKIRKKKNTKMQKEWNCQSQG